MFKSKRPRFGVYAWFPWEKQNAFLEITVHKFKCRDCGSASWVRLPFAIGKLPMTKAFVNYILSFVKIATVKSTAVFLDLQWKTVKKHP